MKECPAPGHAERQAASARPVVPPPPTAVAMTSRPADQPLACLLGDERPLPRCPRLPLAVGCLLGHSSLLAVGGLSRPGIPWVSVELSSHDAVGEQRSRTSSDGAARPSPTPASGYPYGGGSGLTARGKSPAPPARGLSTSCTPTIGWRRPLAEPPVDPGAHGVGVSSPARLGHVPRTRAQTRVCPGSSKRVLADDRGKPCFSQISDPEGSGMWTRTGMSTKNKLTLGAMGGVLCAAGALAAVPANAATPGCAPHCIQVFSARYGTPTDPRFVETVYRGTAAVGTPAILAPPSTTDPAGDIIVSAAGTVTSFYQIGMVSAAVNERYGPLDAVQLEYAPNGVRTGLCSGLDGTPYQ